MDWDLVFNWPGITMCVSVVSGAICFIVREVEHKRTARFDIALSKIYQELERYIQAANKVRTNINIMPLENILCRDAKSVDEWLTIPIFELQYVALQIEMFFSVSNRKPIEQLVESALAFKYETHKTFEIGLTKVDQLNIYDMARVKFNEGYKSSMAALVEIVHNQLLGKWYIQKRTK